MLLQWFKSYVHNQQFKPITTGSSSAVHNMRDERNNPVTSELPARPEKVGQLPFADAPSLKVKTSNAGRPAFRKRGS